MTKLIKRLTLLEALLLLDEYALSEIRDYAASDLREPVTAAIARGLARRAVSGRIPVLPGQKTIFDDLSQSLHGEKLHPEQLKRSLRHEN